MTYTQLLNERAGIESDVTITRLADDWFRLITGTAFGSHDLAWLRGRLPAGPEGDTVRLTDVTSAYACFGLWGPRARDILAGVTAANLDNDAFPYLTAQEIAVGDVPCLAVRVTYVGELGWELYCPTEFGLHLWDTLWEAGQDHGLVAAGYRAIESLRLEKGYRAWGSDITPETTPDEAGISFAVRMTKEIRFIGQAAMAARRAPGRSRKLCCLVLDDPVSVVLGGEPIRHGDSMVGRVTSGGYGYTVRQSIAYAYLPYAQATPGTALEVEVFGEWVSAHPVREPLWDRKGERIRA